VKREKVRPHHSTLNTQHSTHTHTPQKIDFIPAEVGLKERLFSFLLSQSVLRLEQNSIEECTSPKDRAHKRAPMVEVASQLVEREEQMSK
jgi:hypothetical protein